MCFKPTSRYALRTSAKSASINFSTPQLGCTSFVYHSLNWFVSILRHIFVFCCFSYIFGGLLRAQTYQSYFTGDKADVGSSCSGGLVLMGGATENDNAMRWFLRQCQGGDVVVLRASGSDGYNQYLFSDLGVSVNSVETIVTPDKAAANDPYVAQQVRNAEGLWIAGGDQANYVHFWKDGPVADALNYLLTEKRAVVGGTSAGMAILGDAYFAALNGSITSQEALANPYSNKMSIEGGDFLRAPFLRNTITDTHYGARNRQGRHLAFMARVAADYGVISKGIACDEYTAVCVDSSGLARVFGRYPESEHFAYFLQTNCENDFVGPETCVNSKPLHWYRNKAAVRVLKLPGQQDGAMTFDLRDWTSANGGVWENWWADQGNWFFAPADGPPACATEASELPVESAGLVWAIPTPGLLRLSVPPDNLPARIKLYDIKGNLLREWEATLPEAGYRLPAYCHGAHIVAVQGKKTKIAQLVSL